VSLSGEKKTKVVELLKEIARGEGAYSRDHLTHCENCVENMKGLAKKALELLEAKT